MKRMTTLLVILMAMAPAMAQETFTPAGLPEEVVFESPVPGLLPEGVEWDADAGTFLVGSLSVGTIHAIADDGTVTERFTDEDLQSTIGIHVADGKLYVANSSASVMQDPNATGLASLVVFDLETGERVSYTDLTAVFEGEGQHFANDVTVDADGNAYVTDSFQPVIYKVTPEGEGSVFASGDLYLSDGFGLNGIEYHAHGYLLAAVAGNAAIIKIPLDDAESAVAVELSEPLSIDGMAIGRDGVVYAVARTNGGQTQEVVAIVSMDEWATAQVIGRVPTGGNATTLALRYASDVDVEGEAEAEGEDEAMMENEAPSVYFVNTYFGQMERTEYQIQRAPLEASEAMGG